MRTLTIILSLLVVLGLSGAKAQAQFGPPEGFGPPSGMMGPGNFGPGGSNPSGQTCRVNGVEVPGSCDEVEGPGRMMGSQGPGGQGEEGNFGPDPDQIQKMQLKGMFMGMKQGMRGMSQGIKMMKSVLPKLVKQGVTPPQELSEAIAKAEEFIAYVGKIKSADDIPDADAFMDRMSDMADVGSVLQEWGPRLGDLMRMGQMMKEADTRMKQVDRDVKRVKAQAAKSKVDLSDLVSGLDTSVAELKQLLADAKAKTDPDEKQDAIESYFDKIGDVYDTVQLIDGLKNLTKMRADWARRLQQNDRDIKQLQKKKLDVGALTAAQQELKPKLGEFDALLKQKPLDQDALLALREEAIALQQQFDDAKDELLGTESNLPQLKVEKFNAPKLDFGAFEQFKKEKSETSVAGDEVPAQ
ncbi:hypothetical protein HY625_00500 [Candidatus Uhrbacteria bacterium]|nr:hypothetical protein [Candidatus Uhrbacteria bacterium]